MAEGEEEPEPRNIETHQLLFDTLRGVYRISRDLQKLAGGSTVSVSKAVLELRTASEMMLSSNPLLLSFSGRLRRLADSVSELHSMKPAAHGLLSFVGHRLKSHEVSRLAWEIEPEIQLLIGRELLLSLMDILTRIRMSTEKSEEEEDKLLDKMSALQERLSRGFDKDFQDLLLRSGIFSELEWVFRNTLLPRRVREKAAVTIRDLVLFNKDVFVGSVLAGGTLKALVSMGSCCSLLVLSSLIKAIRSPLVDELESSGCMLDIVGYLSSEEVERRAMALHCIMQAGYFGRKEAIESLINSGLISTLVELVKAEEVSNPFSDCVARFVMQLEAGEGLRLRERRAFKAQILNKVREACDSDAEAAAIVADVLWCSSP